MIDQPAVLSNDPDLALMGIPIDCIMIDAKLKDSALGYIQDVCSLRKVCIVCDQTTYDLLGALLEEQCTKANISRTVICFESGVQPKMQHVTTILGASKTVDLIVGVGSGTINDLCKYASYLSQTPYVIWATAPSMNGYTSANASIIDITGYRNTYAACLPKGIFMDLDILATAPRRLILSGVGDAACRSTAQADWLLSHLLLHTPYTHTPFELLYTFESKLLECDLENLYSTDYEAMRLLCKVLLLSGIGMYLAQGSHPASQGEHMIAHAIHMMYGASLPQTYHGEEIAVTTLTMAYIQEHMLDASTPPILTYQPPDKGKLETLFGKAKTQQCLNACNAKQFSAPMLASINHTLHTQWDDIRQAIYRDYLRYKQLRAYLIHMGCATHYSMIGWKTYQYKTALQVAHCTRDRFTFLDLLQSSKDIPTHKHFQNIIKELVA